MSGVSTVWVPWTSVVTCIHKHRFSTEMSCIYPPPQTSISRVGSGWGRNDTLSVAARVWKHAGSHSSAFPAHINCTWDCIPRHRLAFHRDGLTLSANDGWRFCLTEECRPACFL